MLFFGCYFRPISAVMQTRRLQGALELSFFAI